jgi:hypothetical protein
MIRKLVRVAVAASLFASTAVLAVDDHNDDKLATAAAGTDATANSFATLDRNGDRRISRSEAGFDRKLSQTFAELDTDGDGFVSMTEFSATEKSSSASN